MVAIVLIIVAVFVVLFTNWTSQQVKGSGKTFDFTKPYYILKRIVWQPRPKDSLLKPDVLIRAAWNMKPLINQNFKAFKSEKLAEEWRNFFSDITVYDAEKPTTYIIRETTQEEYNKLNEKPEIETRHPPTGIVKHLLRIGKTPRDPDDAKFLADIRKELNNGRLSH